MTGQGSQQLTGTGSHGPPSLPGAGQHSVECRTFPGLPRQVREARQWMAPLLASFPAADDALLALGELASNAVIHSNSRLPRGVFTVRAVILTDLVRIEVTDDGGVWHGQFGPDPQYGRGLSIVAALASTWGITGDQTSRTAYCEIAVRQEMPPLHAVDPRSGRPPTP
jgi:serine/threonine-protein kinase RsbW